MARTILDVEQVRAGYGDAEILRGVDLHADEAEIVTIIGPNGAGKSTLLKTIFGLLKPTAGHVRLDGRDLAGLRPERLVKEGMGYVPQVDNVFPNLTVRENLEMGAFSNRDPAKTARAMRGVHDLFPILEERADQKVGKMSGGQRQMVAMGRALMTEPRVLLLDEPSAGLAPNITDTVFANVRRVAESGTPVVLVEQNAKKALALCDRAYVLDQGRNKYEGPGAELLADPKIGKLYLGG